jgi:hypothetical protein
MNKNGVVLEERGNRVVIATGLTKKSPNSKTGGMIQIYILHRHESPVAAVKSGADYTNCGTCKHRSQDFKERGCFVNVGQGPSSVFKAYRRGAYRKATRREFSSLFGGRTVRFGSYGDPAFMKPETIQGIASVAEKWTGYTHQWTKRPDLQSYFMASVDTPAEADQAAASGWRYFRVSPFGDSRKLQGEISCPASAEAGKRTVCADCKLCDGARQGDARKNIVIQDHSTIKRTNNSLIQIQGVR